MTKPALSLCALMLGSACTSAAPTLTPDELMASPELYVDATVVLTGQPLDYDNLVNAAACTEPGPCNNVRGYFALRGAGDPISARTSASLPSTPVALGVTPQDCFDEPCLSGTNLGCHGNDAEAFCAPELPVNIERVIGRLVRVDGDLVFEVDDVVLVDAPVASDGIFLPMR